LLVLSRANHWRSVRGSRVRAPLVFVRRVRYEVTASDVRLLTAAALSPRCYTISGVRPRRWLYDTTEDRLFLISGDQRQEVPLSPQQHRLVAYMVRRNQSAAGTSVLCERGELIDAVWPDESGHS